MPRLRRQFKDERDFAIMVPGAEAGCVCGIASRRCVWCAALAAVRAAIEDERSKHPEEPPFFWLRAPVPEERTHVIWKRRGTRGLAHAFMDDGRALCVRGTNLSVTDEGAARLGAFRREDPRICALCASYIDAGWAVAIMRREAESAAPAAS